VEFVQGQKFCKAQQSFETQISAELEKRTNGVLKFEFYASSSLNKTNAQFSSMRKAAPNPSLAPLALKLKGEMLPHVVSFRRDSDQRHGGGQRWFHHAD